MHAPTRRPVVALHAIAGPARGVRIIAVAVAALLLAACGGTTAPPTEPQSSAPKLQAISGDPGFTIAASCVPSGPELCFDARDDNCNGLIDEGCGLETGLVQFVTAWGEATADVDLDVTDPSGELAEPGRSTKSGLTKDRDCPGRNADCRGQNVENVFLERGDPPRGSYEARIRLEKLGEATPPVRVTFGARVGPKTYAAELSLERPESERVIRIEL